ncbi:MAG: hypothetical protein Kow00111_26580 [Thermincola ferriacetica]
MYITVVTPTLVKKNASGKNNMNPIPKLFSLNCLLFFRKYVIVNTRVKEFETQTVFGLLFLQDWTKGFWVLTF